MNHFLFFDLVIDNIRHGPIDSHAFMGLNVFRIWERELIINEKRVGGY